MSWSSLREKQSSEHWIRVDLGASAVERTNRIIWFLEKLCSGRFPAKVAEHEAACLIYNYIATSTRTDLEYNKRSLFDTHQFPILPPCYTLDTVHRNLNNIYFEGIRYLWYLSEVPTDSWLGLEGVRTTTCSPTPLAFFLHDMTEAYAPDLNALVKDWVVLRNPENSSDTVSFRDWESLLLERIAQSFGVTPYGEPLTKGFNPIQQWITKTIDKSMARTEADYFKIFTSSEIDEGEFGIPLYTVRKLMDRIHSSHSLQRPMIRHSVLPQSRSVWGVRDPSWDNSPLTPISHTLSVDFHFWRLFYLWFPYHSFWNSEYGELLLGHISPAMQEPSGLRHCLTE
jgi:hypothetical protein